MLRKPAVLSLLVLCTCSSGSLARLAEDLSDSAMEMAIERAIRKGDRARAVELVNTVLEDSLQHTYRYGYYSRKEAFRAISELKLRESADLMREVAAMPYKPPPARAPGVASPEQDLRSNRDLLELVAITGALDELTHLGDSEASRLNLWRLNQQADASLIRGRAIHNLSYLKEWNATEDVRKAAKEAALTPEAILYLTAAAGFLAESPLACQEDCLIGQRLKNGYQQCFETSANSPGIPGCRELRWALDVLAARLHCAVGGG
jgi:hypothetical protein